MEVEFKVVTSVDRLVLGRGDGSSSVFGRYKIYPVTAKHNMKAQLGRHLLGTKMYSQKEEGLFPINGVDASATYESYWRT
jgi:hypothetical protein